MYPRFCTHIFQCAREKSGRPGNEAIDVPYYYPGYMSKLPVGCTQLEEKGGSNQAYNFLYYYIS